MPILYSWYKTAMGSINWLKYSLEFNFLEMINTRLHGLSRVCSSIIFSFPYVVAWPTVAMFSAWSSEIWICSFQFHNKLYSV
jgi:hypothetical protein